MCHILCVTRSHSAKCLCVSMCAGAEACGRLEAKFISINVEQCRTENAQLGQRAGRHRRGALSQKHPLQAVSGHAALILGLGVALRVGAARRGALWGAQVVHERQPILSTEVHKFDLANTRIEVHACGGEEHVAAQ